MVCLASDLSTFVVQLIGLLSLPVVGLAGLVLCLRHRSRPRRIRTAVGGAFAVQLSGYFVLPMIGSHLYASLAPGQGLVDPRIAVPHVLSSIVSGTALGLLLYAALTPDDSPSAPSAPSPHET